MPGRNRKRNSPSYRNRRRFWGGCDIQVTCSVAAGKGGVNSRMTPPPPATTVTLTDYSVSSALITLRRPPPAAAQPVRLQWIDTKRHTENPPPTPSRAWTLESTELQKGPRRSVHSLGAPWARTGVPFTLVSPLSSSVWAKGPGGFQKFAE